MKTTLRIVLMAILGLFMFQGSSAVGNTLDDMTGPVVAMSALTNEYAEKELIKHFRHAGTWLAKITNKSQWVGNDSIKLGDIGADPMVLINNTTYPINVTSRSDGETSISLYKYDTENTKVTDDEAEGLAYDKVGSVQQQHRETLEERTREHALHSLAPTGNTANTPVITTTGPDDGTGRKRLVSADLVSLKKKLDKLKIPGMGRVLVLSPDHVADLLLEDKALNNQYHNHKEGAIVSNYYGFQLYEDVYAPEYDGAGAKIPFDSATTGKAASVIFHQKTTAKARGTVQRYFADAKTNPTMRETVVGFRLYFIAIPLRELGQAAIISG